MEIQFFNSLGRRKESFIPLEKGKVGIYSCGPTVYATPHIGNFRAFIFADLLRRSLEFLGFAVKHVMNVTDVGHLVSDGNEGEDKLEKGAAREGISPLEVARKYEDEFLRDLQKLNILKPHQLPRASEHIDEQIELIKKLESKGFTYETSDGIYFDTSKFENYGKLSGQKMEEKVAGARVEVNSEKRNPADFALWKFCVGENANHVLRWDFETASDLSNKKQKSEIENLKSKIGFPGWHLECSAMSQKYLGETFDIHTGGVDHIPVHHENEIAQSEAATGKKFVSYWLHNEFLTVDGGKMSKSLGNLFTLEDLQKKDFEPPAFRYFCLNSNYRGKLNFSWEALTNAQNSLQNLRKIYQNLPDGAIDDAAVEKFGAALADDLNSPQALAVVWDFAKSPAANRTTLAKFDEVLGLDLGRVEKVEKIAISAAQKKQLAIRKTARAEKDFAKSDAIRDEFLAAGFEIEDARDGEQIVKRKTA
ncbi:cysteine--tRNA ligase [Candidatus Gracilibacteria bacterium]|nr:cysteine--tRNA ligase [Candidatus Gracilibacteria bacterium]MCF7855989.1 cysteine--tRNA ligase [Candidatus Gracilibacteria bacterium]MCF7896318.1 cysteine--tRNA ligase [Candidatus Gracilibacteria bacterium]